MPNFSCVSQLSTPYVKDIVQPPPTTAYQNGFLVVFSHRAKKSQPAINAFSCCFLLFMERTAPPIFLSLSSSQ